MKRLLPLVVGMGALLLVGAGCFGSTTTTTNTSTTTPPTNEQANANANAAANANANTNEAAARTSITVSLRAVTGAKEYGTVTLAAADKNHTLVSISLLGEPKNIVGEAQIRAGLCGDQGSSIQYPLSPLVKGKSVTTLNANFSSFMGGTKQSVWVKSDPVDTDSPQGACGNIY